MTGSPQYVVNGLRWHFRVPKLYTGPKPNSPNYVQIGKPNTNEVRRVTRARTRYSNCPNIETIPKRDVATVVKFQQVGASWVTTSAVVLLAFLGQLQLLFWGLGGRGLPVLSTSAGMLRTLAWGGMIMKCRVFGYLWWVSWVWKILRETWHTLPRFGMLPKFLLRVSHVPFFLLISQPTCIFGT